MSYRSAFKNYGNISGIRECNDYGYYRPFMEFIDIYEENTNRYNGKVTKLRVKFR